MVRFKVTLAVNSLLEDSKDNPTANKPIGHPESSQGATEMVGRGLVIHGGDREW